MKNASKKVVGLFPKIRGHLPHKKAERRKKILMGLTFNETLDLTKC